MLWRKSKQHKWGRDGGAWGMSATLPGAISEGLTDKVTFEQRFKVRE